MDVARLLHKTDKPVFLVVNKVDNAMRMDDAMEFYNLGLGEYFIAMDGKVGKKE